MLLNGQFPSTMLAFLGWPEADHLRLVPAAAASLTRLAAKFERDHRRPLYVSDAYRTLASQVSLKISKGVFAATPGTSNHGIGLAVDLASRINVDGSAEHRWMEVNGPAFGWINPAWAVDWNPRNGQHEPWHWEYRAWLDTHPTVTPQPKPAPTLPAPLTPEDDMPLNATDLAQVRAAVSDEVAKLLRGSEYALIRDAAAPAIAKGVWGDSLVKGDVGPAAAGDWLTDIRLLVGQLTAAIAALPKH